MLQIAAANVLQLHAFEVMPDPLIGVELGSIGGKSDKLQEIGFQCRQPSLENFALVDTRPIPDQQQLPRHLLEQMLQERDDVHTLERMRQDRGVELAFGGDGTDHRQMLMRQLAAQDRGLPDRGISSSAANQEVEGAFIYIEESSTFFACPFLAQEASLLSNAGPLRHLVEMLGERAFGKSSRSL